MLFNSHILSDVHELCTRIAIMRDGRVVWTATVDEALAEAPTLEDFFMKVVHGVNQVAGDRRQHLQGDDPRPGARGHRRVRPAS